MGLWDTLFGKKEAPKQDSQELITTESAERVQDRAATNREATVSSIAENMFNKGMVTEGKGRTEKMAIATEMANEAISLLNAEQMQTMETMNEKELRDNVGHLAGAAVAAYDNRQAEIVASEAANAASLEEDAADTDAAKEAAQKEAA